MPSFSYVLSAFRNFLHGLSLSEVLLNIFPHSVGYSVSVVTHRSSPNCPRQRLMAFLLCVHFEIRQEFGYLSWPFLDKFIETQMALIVLHSTNINIKIKKCASIISKLSIDAKNFLSKSNAHYYHSSNKLLIMCMKRMEKEWKIHNKTFAQFLSRKICIESLNWWETMLDLGKCLWMTIIFLKYLLSNSIL